MKKYLFLVVSSILMPAAMQANIVVNGSFELPASSNSPSLPVGSTYLDGWTVINAEIAQIRSVDFPQVPAFDGAYSLDLAGYHDSSPFGGVRQVLSTIPGATYTLAFSLGAANGTSTVDVSAGNLSTTFSSVAPSLTQVWSTASFQFIASAATTNLDITGLSGSASNQYIGLDLVSVELAALPTGVPEPSTLGLTAAVLAGVGILHRRRKRQA